MCVCKYEWEAEVAGEDYFYTRNGKGHAMRTASLLLPVRATGRRRDEPAPGLAVLGRGLFITCAVSSGM